MFKKTANIALSFMLLFSTVGLTVTKHYCGNSLVKITIFTKPAPCCQKDGCCHNESSVFQFKANYFLPDKITNSGGLVTDIQSFAFAISNLNGQLNPGFTSLIPDESPPPLSAHAILSLFQTYLC